MQTLGHAGGVASVLARWNLGPESDEVAMTLSGGYVYEGVSSPFSNTGELSAVIVAWDQAGNEGQAGPLTVQVLPCPE